MSIIRNLEVSTRKNGGKEGGAPFENLMTRPSLSRYALLLNFSMGYNDPYSPKKARVNSNYHEALKGANNDLLSRESEFLERFGVETVYLWQVENLLRADNDLGVGLYNLISLDTSSNVLAILANSKKNPNMVFPFAGGSFLVNSHLGFIGFDDSAVGSTISVPYGVSLSELDKNEITGNYQMFLREVAGDGKINILTNEPIEYQLEGHGGDPFGAAAGD